MRMQFLFLAATLAYTPGCKEAAEDDTEECYTDDDCPAGQSCVITHDHEGDDHDHGGACENPE
jgi:hypothetical protein